MASARQQLELWAREVLEHLPSGVEDSFVELKAQWPDPKEVARQLAGHANAARGHPLLWLIGVDERRGVVEFEHREPSTWFAQVRAQFEGDVWPDMETDLRMSSDGKPLVALLFRTDRAPYQVKNPNFTGGVARWEVPWREAGGTRTARREDLVRILAPASLSPSIEVLTAKASVNVERTEIGTVVLTLYASAEIYIVPASRDRLVYPSHRCSMELDCKDDGLYRFDRLSLQAPDPELKGITAGMSGAFVDAPGVLLFSSSLVIPSRALFASEEVELVLRLQGANAPGLALIRRIGLSKTHMDPSHQKASWSTFYARDL